ncbi:MAG: acetoacetate--CoA ligase [Sphingomonadales bacterium]
MPPTEEGENALASDQAGLTANEAANTPLRGRILREPTAQDVETSTLTALLRWLAEHRALTFSSYAELWEWSVSEPEQFWGALWDYFEVESSTPYDAVCHGSTIQNMAWFPGAQLNFAQHLLRHERGRGDRLALICYAEDGSRTDWTWANLGDAVRRVATALRAMGIQKGDRVAGYLPNVAEAAIAFIATTAIGAIWSSCSPEFGASAARDRFGQVEPKLLLAVPRYRYAGKEHDRAATLNDIIAGLPSVEHVVLVGDTDWQPPTPGAQVWNWASLIASAAPPLEQFQFEQVPASHPLWIVYTSGTSGPPKAVVHSHVGALLGTMKDLGFHIEVTDRSRLFFYCTTSWVVWNLLLGGLGLGASVVLYDGSPFHPDIGQLWRVVEETEATAFTTSPGFISKMIDKSYFPAARHSIEQLDILVLAGAVAEDSVCEWLASTLPPQTRIISQAGSTEICGGYAGGVKLLPNRAGEMTARVLGMNVDAVDPNGNSVRGQPGELIIRSPFPNAPQCLWNDPTGARFYEAYLSEYPGMWRQGDRIAIYHDGACRVIGRSDATIKRHGIRMGSNEIYRTLAAVKEIADFITVCPQEGSFSGELILFVQLAGGRMLDDSLKRHITNAVADGLSPRHTPDRIVPAATIPYTATGKRLEVPLRELLEGRLAPERFALSLQHDLDTADWYIALTQQKLGVGT